eukprot:966192-Alexandrium_andersonii.AAC.1
MGSPIASICCRAVIHFMCCQLQLMPVLRMIVPKRVPCERRGFAMLWLRSPTHPGNRSLY